MREAEGKHFHEATRSAPPLRRAWIITILLLLAALAWLAFSFYLVATLRNKASELQHKAVQLQTESEELDKTIKLKKSELTDKQRLIETLAPLLDLTALVISEPAMKARHDIKVQYMSRDIRPEMLTSIKQFGFSVEDKIPPNDEPTTNIILFGKNVSTDDVKLVAYILVKNSFKLADIKQFKNSAGLENVIQVGELGKPKNKSYLTVTQIAEKKTFIDAEVNISWLSGTWAGEATQIVSSQLAPGETGKWTIVLTVQNGKYAVEYPSLSCQGKWTLLKKSPRSIKFKEKIISGEKCLDNGYVTIEKKDSSKILFNYISPDGTGVTSFAVLTRQ